MIPTCAHMEAHVLRVPRATPPRVAAACLQPRPPHHSPILTFASSELCRLLSSALIGATSPNSIHRLAFSLCIRTVGVVATSREGDWKGKVASTDFPPVGESVRLISSGVRRGAINSNGASGCFKGRTSYWIQTVPTGVTAAKLTV